MFWVESVDQAVASINQGGLGGGSVKGEQQTCGPQNFFE